MHCRYDAFSAPYAVNPGDMVTVDDTCNDECMVDSVDLTQILIWLNSCDSRGDLSERTGNLAVMTSLNSSFPGVWQPPRVQRAHPMTGCTPKHGSETDKALGGRKAST